MLTLIRPRLFPSTTKSKSKNRASVGSTVTAPLSSPICRLEKRLRTLSNKSCEISSIAFMCVFIKNWYLRISAMEAPFRCLHSRAWYRRPQDPSLVTA